MKLGKLKEIDLRKIWPHEQYNFSQWLSQDANMKELSDVLGLSLTDIKTEVYNGSYRCDILCKDEVSQQMVIIENQLEPTNHDHLGKLITYASGLDASVIVWIVPKAKPEHASAIEWLNSHTLKNVSFFLLELHAYSIDDSAPAPMFKIIEQPNDFAKTIKELSGKGDLSATAEKWLDFWTAFNDVLDSQGKPFNKRKPSTNHWYSVAIGSSQCHIDIDLLNKEHRVRVGVLIPDNKVLYDLLYNNKQKIENRFGSNLSWYNNDDKKASGFCTYLPGLDLVKQSDHTELMKRIIDTVVLLRDAVKDFLSVRIEE